MRDEPYPRQIIGAIAVVTVLFSVVASCRNEPVEPVSVATAPPAVVTPSIPSPAKVKPAPKQRVKKPAPVVRQRASRRLRAYRDVALKEMVVLAGATQAFTKSLRDLNGNHALYDDFDFTFRLAEALYDMDKSAKSLKGITPVPLEAQEMHARYAEMSDAMSSMVRKFVHALDARDEQEMKEAQREIQRCAEISQKAIDAALGSYRQYPEN